MKLDFLFLSILTFTTMCSGGGQQNCPLQGPPGQPGIPGTPGAPGIPGTPGALGSTMGCSPVCRKQDRAAKVSTTYQRRWKQCFWTYDQGKDGRDSGKVHECDFVKKGTDTYLRVVYMGNLRIQGCTGCCRRWYFTFNGAECKVPAPIDGSLYHGVNINIHRPANIEGYCGGIPAGRVKVGFNVGSCAGGNLKSGDAYTSWNQSNKVIIEEVEPPVA